MKPVFGGILLALGMATVTRFPVAGVIMLGIGYWLLEQSTPSQKQSATSIFFGIALLGMLVTGVAALL